MSPIYSFFGLAFRKYYRSVAGFLELCNNLRDRELYKVPNDKMKFAHDSFLLPFVCSCSPAESIMTNFFSVNHPATIVSPPSLISEIETIENGE